MDGSDWTGRMDGEGRAFGGVAKTTEKTIPYLNPIILIQPSMSHRHSVNHGSTYLLYLPNRPLRFYLSFPFTLLYLSTSSEMRKVKKSERVAIG